MLERLIEEVPRFFSYYNMLFLAQAMLATVALSAIGCLTGAITGLALAFVRLGKGPLWWPAQALAIVFTELFRRIPFLVTLMLVFFASQISGLNLSLFAVACVAVFLIASAFLSEIIRAGFDSVHANQWDAAAAMNFSMYETIRFVVLPQAWRIILPPGFGFFILFIKDTALASQIGVVELTYAGKVLNNKGFSAALVFGTMLLLYFAISYPLSRYGAYLEAKLAQSRNR